MATKFKPPKEKTESLWETLLDMGLFRALSLIWTIMLFVFGVTMYIVVWLTKRSS